MISQRSLPGFDAFVAASSDRLLRTAYLLCGDRGHAEDLVQTALMRTARRWRTARELPEAYARRVLINLAKDRWRQLGRRPAELPLDVAPDRSIEVPASTSALDREDLLRAAANLPPGQRAVLVLRYFDDLSVEETAAALGVSPGTVKSQTSRALDNLRAALAPTKENADVDR
ncbi:MAG TPA: SigE family RNA polymerase sigma factor [Marmoricola sp.]|jgi:RNA polymerase sigma-70 factor (sigma-E family)|nr:SigE family RNA polymerase sigma factor [Marmoricola sp.]